MPSNALIPDRQLTFSPDLATKIGLEEAILLQGIGPSIPRTEDHWHALVIPVLEQQFPFWSKKQIRALLNRLSELGIITLLPGDDHNSVRITKAKTYTQAYLRTEYESYSQASTTTPRHMPSTSEHPETWHPSEAVLDLLTLNHGISHEFAMAQLATFDQSASHHTRESRFRQHTLAAWRHEQSTHSAFDIPPPLPFDNQWQPSEDAIEIMARANIDLEFINSMRAEFILYWQERGGPPKEVNSKFIGWIRQRWTRQKANLIYNTEPRPMVQDWQPSEQVYEVLALSGIDREYAQQRIPEFILYWYDSNELHTSWNSKFLQHVKHQWRHHQEPEHGEKQGSKHSSRADHTRERSIADDLTDTSWAN